MRLDMSNMQQQVETLIWQSFHTGLAITLMALTAGLFMTWRRTRNTGRPFLRLPDGRPRRFVAVAILLPVTVLAYGYLYKVYHSTLRSAASTVYVLLEKEAPSDISNEGGARQWRVHNLIAFQKARRVAMLTTFGAALSLVLLVLQWLLRSLGIMRVERPVPPVIILCLFGHLCDTSARHVLVESWTQAFLSVSSFWAAVVVFAVAAEIGGRQFAARLAQQG